MAAVGLLLHHCCQAPRTFGRRLGSAGLPSPASRGVGGSSLAGPALASEAALSAPAEAAGAGVLASGGPVKPGLALTDPGLTVMAPALPGGLEQVEGTTGFVSMAPADSD